MTKFCILNKPINILLKSTVIHKLCESNGWPTENFIVKLIGYSFDNSGKFRYSTIYYYYKNEICCSEIYNLVTVLLSEKDDDIRFIGNEELTAKNLFHNCKIDYSEIDFDNYEDKDCEFSNLYYSYFD